ncbi:hypothetical protein D9M68_186210 [compost metagenome]
MGRDTNRAARLGIDAGPDVGLGVEIVDDIDGNRDADTGAAIEAQRRAAGDALHLVDADRIDSDPAGVGVEIGVVADDGTRIDVEIVDRDGAADGGVLRDGACQCPRLEGIPFAIGRDCPYLD